MDAGARCGVEVLRVADPQSATGRFMEETCLKELLPRSYTFLTSAGPDGAKWREHERAIAVQPGNNEPCAAFRKWGKSDLNIKNKGVIMRHKLTSLLGVSLLVSALASLTGTRCDAGTVSYNEFESGAGLILQGHTAPFEGRLRLTPAIGGQGIGGAWLETKQPVQDGFETTFQIQITDKYVHGADGLAFVIQNGPAPHLGWPGGNICFGGLTNLFVVKFDNYHWQNQDLICWSFASDDVASRLSRVLAQLNSSNEPPADVTVPLFRAPGLPASDPTPLVRDPAFGYALPHDVRLTPRIEASTDLVHWMPLTNALFYFRDPASTHYSARFYRFPKE
jgi:Bacterial lectin